MRSLSTRRLRAARAGSRCSGRAGTAAAGLSPPGWHRSQHGPITASPGTWGRSSFLGRKSGHGGDLCLCVMGPSQKTLQGQHGGRRDMKCSCLAGGGPSHKPPPPPGRSQQMLQDGDTLLALTVVTLNGDTTESTKSLTHTPKTSRAGDTNNQHQHLRKRSHCCCDQVGNKGGTQGPYCSLLFRCGNPSYNPPSLPLHFIIQPRTGENSTAM